LLVGGAEQVVALAGLRFQGIFARSIPIPHVSVIPANTNPAPMKAESPNSTG
jgi:hypothetical protein